MGERRGRDRDELTAGYYLVDSERDVVAGPFETEGEAIFAAGERRCDEEECSAVLHVLPECNNFAWGE